MPRRFGQGKPDPRYLAIWNEAAARFERAADKNAPLLEIACGAKGRATSIRHMLHTARARAREAYWRHFGYDKTFPLDFLEAAVVEHENLWFIVLRVSCIGATIKIYDPNTGLEIPTPAPTLTPWLAAARDEQRKSAPGPDLQLDQQTLSLVQAYAASQGIVPPHLRELQEKSAANLEKLKADHAAAAPSPEQLARMAELAARDRTVDDEPLFTNETPDTPNQGS